MSIDPQHPDGSPLDFTAAGTAIDYVGSGWGQPESWGTWTVGQRAEITIPLTAPLEHGGVLVATVVPYLPRRYPTLSATIRYRGRVIGEWSFEREGPTTCSVTIAADLMVDDPRPSFTFDVPDARSPAQAGESMDPRLLALGFQSLRLERLAGTAPRQEARTAVGGNKVGSVGRLLKRRPDPQEAFIARATRIGRRVLPCTDIEVLWEDMWDLPGQPALFPVPEAVEPEGATWESLASLAATYLHDAHDYWFHRYQPRAGDVIVDIGAGRAVKTPSRSLARSATRAGSSPSRRIPCRSRRCRNSAPSNGLANGDRAEPGLRGCAQPASDSGLCRTGSRMRSAPAIRPLAALPWTACRSTGSGVNTRSAQIDFLKMNIEGADGSPCPAAAGRSSTRAQVCIAAHDFRADRGEEECYRTAHFVREALTEAGFHLTPRDDARPWARNHIHGGRPACPERAERVERVHRKSW